MKKQKLPPDWSSDRIATLATAYEHQSEDEALAEDEAPFIKGKTALVEIPVELVPQVQQLIIKHKSRQKGK